MDAISYREEVKRKLIHLSSLWMPVAVMLIPDWRITAGIFAFGLAGTLISEHGFACGWPVVTPVYRFFFGRMLREKPRYGAWIVSGGSYVFAAALLVELLYRPAAAAGALCVMLTADAAAALIGRRFGRHAAPNGKSVEGVISFIAVGCAVLSGYFIIIGAPPEVWLCGNLALLPAAAAELFEKQLRIDDNFTIPLIAGAGIQLGLWLS